MKKSIALEVKNLTVVYPESTFPVVEDVSFSIPERKIVMLIGPNGSGKTTVIKAILGLVPYKGEILFFGQPLERSHRFLGYVPQRFSFDTNLPITVDETIAMHLLNAEEKEKKKRVKTALREFNIEGLEKKPLGSLSGGQLQRVLLARVMVHDPKILLLDEPETGIDVGGETTLYQLLEKMVKDKDLTILIASHELGVVFKHADLAICMNRKIFCQGKPEKILTKETLMKLYGSQITLYSHKHG